MEIYGVMQGCVNFGHRCIAEMVYPFSSVNYENDLGHDIYKPEKHGPYEG